MTLIVADNLYGLDFDNIDIIEPIYDKDDVIKDIKVVTKSQNSLILSIEQYKVLLVEYKVINIKNC